MLLTLYEHKDDLLQCFQMVRDSGDFDPVTVREAGDFVRMVEELMMIIVSNDHATCGHAV